jgi:hypothetical protein
VPLLLPDASRPHRNPEAAQQPDAKCLRRPASLWGWLGPLIVFGLCLHGLDRRLQLSLPQRGPLLTSHNTCYLLLSTNLRPLAVRTAILHSAHLFLSLPEGLAVRRVAERYRSSKHRVLGTIPQMSDFCRCLGVTYRCELPASSTPAQALEWRGEKGVDRLENRLGKPLEDMIRAVVFNIISIVISGVSSEPP